MRLKKAIETSTSYPTKESIKPILLSLSVTLALSACTTTPPPIDEAKNNEVSMPAEVAGGIPADIIPPTDSNNSKTPSNFKKKLIKK